MWVYSFFLSRLSFWEQFWAHVKIEQEVQRFPIYPQCPPMHNLPYCQNPKPEREFYIFHNGWTTLIFHCNSKSMAYIRAHSCFHTSYGLWQWINDMYMCARLLQSCLDSLQPYGLQSDRPLCPRAPTGKNTGVGFHAFLHALTQGLNHIFYIGRWIFFLTTRANWEAHKWYTSTFIMHRLMSLPWKILWVPLLHLSFPPTPKN